MGGQIRRDDFSHPTGFPLQLDLAGSWVPVRVVVPGRLSEHALSGGYRKYEAWINSLVNQVTTPVKCHREPVPPVAFFHRRRFRAGVYLDQGLPEDYELCCGYVPGFPFGKFPKSDAWRERPYRFSRKSSNYSLTAFYRTKACTWTGSISQERRVVIAGSGHTARRLSLWMIRTAFVGSLHRNPRKRQPRLSPGTRWWFPKADDYRGFPWWPRPGNLEPGRGSGVTSPAGGWWREGTFWCAPDPFPFLPGVPGLPMLKAMVCRCAVTIQPGRGS